jgi:hypothetical protein
LNGLPKYAVMVSHRPSLLRSKIKGEGELEGTIAFVMPQAGHRGVVACHMAFASELTTYRAAKGEITCEETITMYLSHKFLLVRGLNISD